MVRVMLHPKNCGVLLGTLKESNQKFRDPVSCVESLVTGGFLWWLDQDLYKAVMISRSCWGSSGKLSPLTIWVEQKFENFFRLVKCMWVSTCFCQKKIQWFGGYLKSWNMDVRYVCLKFGCLHNYAFSSFHNGFRSKQRLCCKGHKSLGSELKFSVGVWTEYPSIIIPRAATSRWQQQEAPPEQWNKPWLFRVYRWLCHPVMWGL